MPQTYGRDKYKRTLPDVLLSDGTHVNHVPVKEGWCWWYRKSVPGDTVAEGLEKAARVEKCGLSAAPHPVLPWNRRIEPILPSQSRPLLPKSLPAGLSLAAVFVILLPEEMHSTAPNRRRSWWDPLADWMIRATTCILDHGLYQAGGLTVGIHPQRPLRSADPFISQPLPWLPMVGEI